MPAYLTAAVRYASTNVVGFPVSSDVSDNSVTLEHFIQAQARLSSHAFAIAQSEQALSSYTATAAGLMVSMSESWVMYMSGCTVLAGFSSVSSVVTPVWEEMTAVDKAPADG